MKQSNSVWRLGILAACSIALPGCEQPNKDAIDAAAEVSALADRYYSETLARTPEAAYFSGIEIDRHDGIGLFQLDTRVPQGFHGLWKSA